MDSLEPSELSLPDSEDGEPEESEGLDGEGEPEGDDGGAGAEGRCCWGIWQAASRAARKTMATNEVCFMVILCSDSRENAR